MIQLPLLTTFAPSVAYRDQFQCPHLSINITEISENVQTVTRPSIFRTASWFGLKLQSKLCQYYCPFSFKSPAFCLKCQKKFSAQLIAPSTQELFCRCRLCTWLWYFYWHRLRLNHRFADDIYEFKTFYYCRNDKLVAAITITNWLSKSFHVIFQFFLNSVAPDDRISWISTAASSQNFMNQ